LNDLREAGLEAATQGGVARQEHQTTAIIAFSRQLDAAQRRKYR
jgi:hypothetical protein